MELGNNIALVLNSFQNQLKSKHTGLKTFHHDNLDHQTLNTALRSKNLIFSDLTRNTEILAYTRAGALTYPETGAFRRASVNYGTSRTGTTVEGFYSVRAEMDINFLYLTSNINKSDHFEIAYGCGVGVSSVKKFQLNLSNVNLGIFDYVCHWEPLESREYMFEDTSYKSIGGNCRLSGNFFLVDGEIGGLIEQINYKLYQNNMDGDVETLLESETIT